MVITRRNGKQSSRIKRVALGTALSLFTITTLLATPAHPQELSRKQDKLLANESGFLGDNYTKLQPDPGNGDWLIWFNHPDVLKRSNTFLVDKVQVFFAPDAPQKNIDQADIDKLTDYFTKAIKDALEAGHYTVVTEPGPGVMTLRFAITRLEPNAGKTNMAVSGTEAVAAHAVVPVPGVSGVIPRIKVGKASIEGEMVDSQSGQVEMAFMTSKSGRRFFSGLKAFQKWGDIDKAFRDWAKNFRQRLDKAHAA